MPELSPKDTENEEGKYSDQPDLNEHLHEQLPKMVNNNPELVNDRGLALFPFSTGSS